MGIFSSRVTKIGWHRFGVLMIAAAFAGTLFQVALAAPLEFRGKALKTAPMPGQMVEPLRKAIMDFDDVAEARGKPPEDAKQRIVRMRAQASPAKAEIRKFVRNLEKEGETEAFDEMIADRIADTAPEVLGELKQQGGATAMLRNADRIIDEMIAAREKAAGNGVVFDFSPIGLLGISDAHAIKSTVCGMFWWTISWGEGTAHAYRSCYY